MLLHALALLDLPALLEEAASEEQAHDAQEDAQDPQHHEDGVVRHVLMGEAPHRSEPIDKQEDTASCEDGADDQQDGRWNLILVFHWKSSSFFTEGNRLYTMSEMTATTMNTRMPMTEAR